MAGLCDGLRAAGIRAFGPSARGRAARGQQGVREGDHGRGRACPPRASPVVTGVDEGMAAVADLGLPGGDQGRRPRGGQGRHGRRDRGRGAGRRSRRAWWTRPSATPGRVVVVEEGMTGPEVSLLAVTDGRAVARFPAARDYKPIGEGNTGPNTGGMGSVSPVPDIPDALADELIDAVHRPVIAAMERRGTPFQGVLYAGLMMTPDGPRVLEFNTRFGDPETQALLPRLDEDALALLPRRPTATWRTGRCGERRRGRLGGARGPRLPRLAALGRRDQRASSEAAATGAEIYHAGTAPGPGGTVVTAGGRVLAVSARGDSVADARAQGVRGGRPDRLRRQADAPRHRGGMAWSDPEVLAAGDGRALDRGGEAGALARGGAGGLPGVGRARRDPGRGPRRRSRRRPASRSSAPRSSSARRTTTSSPSSPTSTSGWARRRGGSTTG